MGRQRVSNASSSCPNDGRLGRLRLSDSRLWVAVCSCDVTITFITPWMVCDFGKQESANQEKGNCKGVGGVVS